ncbi:LacI family DNA-binding transcriptional regulator [Mycolicibacterium sp.]|uniref:LacI family DNA-binding transcriptional regulator n=1 Tax=Mycolicibacterium sp. TaxID=2320850 RepID=UPI0037C6F41C
MSGPGRTVTLQDVAREADVAVSTVSRALSNPDRVSRPMRERIQEVAKRLGYTSGRLPVRESLLALMVSGIGNPYNAQLIRGVESQARAAGSALILGDIADGPEVESAHLERLADRGLDGLILASSVLPEADLHALGTEVALFNREVTGVPGVVTDARDGSRQIVEHLAALGHRHLAYLSGPSALWSDNERWQGLAENASRLGVEITRLGPFLPTLDQGTPAADVGLGSGATALVAFNDLLAIGMLQRLRRRNVDVPGAVSVVGYDDIFGADFCQPSLTTVHTDAEHAGRTLVDLVLGRIATRLDAPIVIPSRLVVRESTGPVGMGA